MRESHLKHSTLPFPHGPARAAPQALAKRPKRVPPGSPSSAARPAEDYAPQKPRGAVRPARLAPPPPSRRRLVSRSL